MAAPAKKWMVLLHLNARVVDGTIAAETTLSPMTLLRLGAARAPKSSVRQIVEAGPGRQESGVRLPPAVDADTLSWVLDAIAPGLPRVSEKLMTTLLSGRGKSR